MSAVKTPDIAQKDAELIEAKSEILKVRAQLRRAEEEREILKKAARYFAEEPELSTSSLTSTDSRGVSKPCVDYSKSPVVGFISGSMNQCRKERLKASDCWH